MTPEEKCRVLETALEEIRSLDDGHWGEGPATAQRKVMDMSRIAHRALQETEAHQ